MECFNFPLVVLTLVAGVVALVARRRAAKALELVEKLSLDLTQVRDAVERLRAERAPERRGEAPPANALEELRRSEAASQGPETPAEPVSVKTLAATWAAHGEAGKMADTGSSQAALPQTAADEALKDQPATDGALVDGPLTDGSLTDLAATTQIGSPPAAAAPAAGASGPPSTPPTSPPAPPPAGARPSFEWERWLGIRGAAVLGGVVLALAALLFLKYAVDQGFFPPVVRISIAILVGLGAVWGSQGMRRRGYGITADAVAGAGIVILYGAVWAGHALYHLIPAVAAFVLMVLITAACAALAWRHRSLVVAILGLAGGFAAPMLLSSLRAEPAGLFGYLLLLNLGLLALARHHRWPILGALGLIVTTLYIVLWLAGLVSFIAVGSGLGVLGLFAVVFALVGATSGPGAAGGRDWRALRSAGLLLPFFFSLRFASADLLGNDFLPLGALLAALSVAALWLARRLGEPLLAFGAACGVAIHAVLWLVTTTFSRGPAWQTVGILTVLVVIFHIGLELVARSDGRGEEPAPRRWLPALTVTGAVLVTVTLDRWALASGGVGPWPWITATALLLALALRQAALRSPGWWPVVAATLASVGQVVSFTQIPRGAPAESEPILLATLALAVGISAWSLLRRRSEARRLDRAAYAFALVAIGLSISWLFGANWTAELMLSATLPFALLAVLAATRLRSGLALAAAVVVLMVVQGAWTLDSTWDESQLLVFVSQLATVAVLTFWPFLAGVGRWAGAAGRRFLVPSALAAPIFFLPLLGLYKDLFGDDAVGLLPIGLGALVLVAAYLGRSLWPLGDERRTSALVWFTAVALGFVSVAIPLQLDQEWITVGWALEGAALIALWRRLDHPGLKYFAGALLAVVAIRLVANPAVLSYHEGASRAWPVLNWLAYTYLLPALSMILAARWLAPLEVARWRPRERASYPSARPWLAYGCGLAAGLVVFVWINLTIFDAFGRGPDIFGSFERQPARDLTLSLAWAVYALVLLTLGIRRHWPALRWASLVLLIVTILKVFLYDLGQLQDLYRVASLVGLAGSLILVSLVYQRFVFRREEPREDEEENR